MTSITDPKISERFTAAMEEIQNKKFKTYGEIIDTTAELGQSHRQFVKSALGMLEVLVVGVPINLHPGNSYFSKDPYKKKNRHMVSLVG